MMARTGFLSVLPDLPDPGVRDGKVFACVLISSKVDLRSREPVLPYLVVQNCGGLSKNSSVNLATLRC